MTIGKASSIDQRLVAFCRALHEQGCATAIAHRIVAARALTLIDAGDRREFYYALRSVLISRPEDYAVFDAAFTAHFDRATDRASRPGDPRLIRPSLPKPVQHQAGALSLRDWLRNGRPASPDAGTVAVPRVSDREASGAEDFRTFGSSELEQLQRVAARLARRLRSQRSRRWQPAARGSSLSFRRTMRHAIRTGGELAALRFRKRRRRRTKLVVLCDVSASMDLYARLLLQFLYALQNSFARVETFVFSTRLERVTQGLKGDSYDGALARLRQQPHGWAGGTRIGASLEQFQRNWPRLVDDKTIVLILSDGWDTGEPAELAAVLRSLHRRAGKLVWLNPLAGSAGYSPETGGMRAALPYIDALVPAHDLRALENLGRHLML
jgi:uncharacterized protein